MRVPIDDMPPVVVPDEVSNSRYWDHTTEGAFNRGWFDFYVNGTPYRFNPYSDKPQGMKYKIAWNQGWHAANKNQNPEYYEEKIQCS